MNSLSDVEARCRYWADYLNITANFEVQVGSFDELPEEVMQHPHQPEAWAVTFSHLNDDGSKEFIVGFREDCPEEKLEHAIVHELIHVHTFDCLAPDDFHDEREAMEAATDLCAHMAEAHHAREKLIERATARIEELEAALAAK